MGRAHVNLETNLGDGVEMFKKLHDEMPKNLDEASRGIADNFRKRGQEILLKRGNVVTGKGVSSLRTKRLGNTKHGVVGNSYLSILDVGRPSGTFPDTSNPRFIAAAQQYGMSRQQLAQTIAEKGTEPYPWIDEASKKTRRIAPKRAKISINKAISESTGVL
jgi:hypothetical protein